MPKQPISIAYILQMFPTITQTFIYREVSVLRERGFSVHTFSIHRPDPASLSAEAIPLMDETFYTLPLSWLSLLLTHLRYLFSRPLRYLGALAFVLTRPGESLKSRRRTLGHFLHGMMIIREIERLKPQHIHAHFGWSASSIALIASRMLGIPFSLTFHAFHTKGAYPVRLLVEDKIRHARFVVTISEYHRQFLKTLVSENGLEDKIHVVHHGLDPDVFTPSPVLRRNGEEFTIVGVGQLITCKGFHVLIEACHHLAERGVPFRCHILGEGPERSQLEKLIAQYKLHNQVLLPGRICQEELRQFLDQADVFVLPCLKDKSGRQDGLPVVLTEAMAMELPVVSTRIAGIPELIDHERNGLLIPPDDAVTLADVLQRLKNDPGLRRQLGKAGRETVLSEFNIYQSAEQLARLFTTFIKIL